LVILDANLLRKALEITLFDQDYQFVIPPLGEAIMDFMNQLGYPGEIHFVSRMAAQISSSLDALGLGNLNFVPKGEINEVFGMKIPKELITDNIRNVLYYNAYLEMVAKHDKKIAAEEGGKKKATSKADKSKK
nr:histone deacetylase 14 [Tanacetum cinerariifolium]